jgi:hypothetical protein
MHRDDERRMGIADSLVHEKGHDGIVQRRHLMLGVLVDEDRDLLRRTLGQHTVSFTGERCATPSFDPDE